MRTSKNPASRRKSGGAGCARFDERLGWAPRPAKEGNNQYGKKGESEDGILARGQAGRGGQGRAADFETVPVLAHQKPSVMRVPVRIGTGLMRFIAPRFGYASINMLKMC